MAENQCNCKKGPDDDDEGGGVPEWMCTFGDMMSLLLTFFIMLYSMSELQSKKTMMVIESLTQQFGHEKTVSNAMPGKHLPTNSIEGKPSSMGRAMRLNLMNGGDKVKAVVGDHPRVKILREGDESQQSGKVLFLPNSFDLTEQNKQTLNQIFDQIAGKPNIVVIRAHTGNKALDDQSPFRNKWDLCYNRSTQVMDYLIGLGLERKRVRLSLSGSNEPQHLDSSGEQEDDRVEVMMMNQTVLDRKGTREERHNMYSPDGLDDLI